MLPILLKQNRLQIFRDTLFVLRGLWFFLLLNGLATWAFLFLPQGTDLLQVLLEDGFYKLHLFPILFLCVAVFYWCISSEFCTRYLLYMTDNSGHALSPGRVLLRKRIQVLIARVFLFFPLFLIALSFLKAFIQNQSDTDFPLSGLLVILLILALEWKCLNYLYHPFKQSYFSKRIKWLNLSFEEKYWTGKLYGIYNNYRIDIPPYYLSDNIALELPRETILPNGAFIPKQFQLIREPLNKHSMQVWMYRIPLLFYKNLLIQFAVLTGSAVCFIAFFSLLNTTGFQIFGAAALICFAFACWQLMYLFLHFLDKAQPIKNVTLTYRLLLIVWLLSCSYFNTDHPVRLYSHSSVATFQNPQLTNSNQNKIPTQLTIPEHFSKWVKNVACNKNNHKETIPIFFIAAEGGALRTGAFTALLLSKIQDSFPDFKNHIYAYSTVSGGGLGAHFFNSLNISSGSFATMGYAGVSRSFFSSNFLSPVIGKLVFGEVLQWLFPLYIPLFDRAITLEKVWEEAWQSANRTDEKQNIFSNSIVQNDASIQPAFFINTVEVETGMPCIYSNLMLGTSFPYADERNVQKRYPLPLRYSTVINLSTRFPLISPAAMLCMDDGGKSISRHFVDGGYYENSGQETVLQVIKAIPFEKYPRVKPYILCFNFSEMDSTIFRGIHFANEFTEIIQAIYQTHNARTALATNALKEYCTNTFTPDQYISLSLDINTKKLPMNWVLSNAALKRVDLYTDALMQQKKSSNDMNKLFKAIISP